MSGNSAWAIVGGVVGGVIGFFIGGPVGALYGFSLGATAAGLIVGPEGPEQTIKPDELRVPTSSESATIPVIFGTSRVAGNHIGYDRDSFKAIPVTQDAGGKGGGGGEQVTGYLYKLTWDLGLCMGPIDELVKVVGSPGDDNVLWKEQKVSLTKSLSITVASDRITGSSGDFAQFEVGMSVFVENASDQDNDRVRGEIQTKAGDDSWIELTSGTFQGADETTTLSLLSKVIEDPIDMTGGEQTVDLSGKNQDQGNVTLYPGSTSQVGNAMNGATYNYRHVCYAHFANFTIGPSPTPRGYLFEMRRMPVCLDTDGNPVSNLQVRASADSTEQEYNDANPAAVVWELLTNQVWGKGMDPALLNEDDFVTASNYYRNNRIGISTSMAGETGMDNLMQKLRAIFGLAVWWDGESVRARVIWDRDNAYSPRTRIDDEDIIGSPVFSRPSIVSSINELRLEFTNRVNNYQSEVVTAQDLASIEELDAVRSETLEAKEIGTRRTAELLTHRLLRELAYQPAKLQLNVHRTFADRGIGEFIELYWQAWRDGGGFTSFWRVEGIRDNETEDNMVTLTLVEDIYATGRDGEIADFTAPIVSIDVDVPLTDDSFGAIDYTLDLPLGGLEPILVEEPNIWMSRGQRYLAFACQRANPSIQSVTVGWAEASNLEYQTFAVLRPFAITGTLLDDISASTPKLCRERHTFRISLNEEDVDAADLLDAASVVQAGTDDFSSLTNSTEALMMINGEIFRIGFIEETGTNEYTIQAYLRSEFATGKAAHTTNDDVFFFPNFVPGDHFGQAGLVPIDEALKFRLQPFAPNGSGDATVVDGPDSNGVDGASIEPLVAHLRTATRAGFDWTIEIRPRIHWGGAGYGPNIDADMLEVLDSIDPLRIRIATSDADSVTIDDFFASGSETDGNLTVTQCEWIPPVRGDGDSGMIQISLTFTGTNPATVNIHQRYSGQEGAALAIPQP